MSKRAFSQTIMGVALLSALGLGVAHAATTTGNASANVMTPLSVAETTPMSFGDVAGDASIGTTVVLSASDTTSAGTGTPYVGGTPTSGAFTVTGAANATYILTMPASVTLNGPGGATMLVNNFTYSTGGAGARTLTAAGTESFKVGATLNINAGQLAGAYTGIYLVQVNY